MFFGQKGDDFQTVLSPLYLSHFLHLVGHSQLCFRKQSDVNESLFVIGDVL